MDKTVRGVAEKIIEAIEETSNDYDAIEVVESIISDYVEEIKDELKSS